MDAPAFPPATIPLPAPDVPSDLSTLDVLGAAALLRARQITAVELLAAVQDRIDAANGGAPTFDGAPRAINAWTRLYPEVAREHATAADRRIADEGAEAPLLCGVPLGLKDLYSVAGLPITASSRVLDGNVATANSVVWERLHAAGMVLVGHLHTHEFAAGATTDQVGNPWDVTRTAGGSSGGSGAAVAAGMVPAATGTDTAGSLRIPASLSGISTIKATRGRIPIGGILPLASTYDHAGPMARTVADCSALLAAMARGGSDVLAQAPPAGEIGDLPLAPRPGGGPLQGLTVAVTDRFDPADLHLDTADGYEIARRALERLGARVVDLPAATPSQTIESPETGTVMFADVWSAHQRYADRRHLYRPGILALLETADPALSADAYVRGQLHRNELAAAWDAWMVEHGVDLILEPTTPEPAPVRGEGGLETGTGATLAGLTMHWDATGHPVVALPSGLGARTGLPIGVSLVARRGDEAAALQAGIDLQAYELEPLTAPR